MRGYLQRLGRFTHGLHYVCVTTYTPNSNQTLLPVLKTPKTPKTAGADTQQLPLSTPNVQGRKGPKSPHGWGYISEPAPAKPDATATAAVAAVAATAPRKRKARTFQQIVDSYKRPDGKMGYTFRDLCPKLHIAAESLRAALKDPGRLSVNSVLALAKLMEVDPNVVMNDIMAEARRTPKAKAAAAAKLARTGKPAQAANQVQAD